MARNELMPFDAAGLMRNVFRDFDTLFTRRGRESPLSGSSRDTFGEFAWTPDVELAERDHHLFARFDLPGMKKEEVTVELTEESLTVSGERRHGREEQGEEWFRSERSYGSFCRVIPLPEGVKTADVKATFGNGVLEVDVPLPVKELAAPRRVAIGEASARDKSMKAAA